MNFFQVTYLNAKCLSEMKAEDAANEAFEAFLKFINENPRAKRMAQIDMTLRSCVDSAEKQLSQKRNCTQKIDQVLKKAKVFIDSKEFRKAIEVLLEIYGNQLNSLDLFCPENRQHIIVYHYYFALCLCRLGDHEKAISSFQESIYLIKKEPFTKFKKKIQTVSSGVYEKLAYCYTHHCHYFPEALSSIKKSLKLNNFSDPKLIEDYLLLLIFNKKFKQANQLIDQFQGQEIGQYLIAYFQKDYKKCLELSETGENLTNLDKENKLQIFILASCLLKTRHYRKAGQIFNLFKQNANLGKHWPLQNVDYAICALENGSPQVTIHYMKTAFQSLEKLQDLTTGFFNTFDTCHPIKFLNHVKKDVQDAQNGSENLRPFRNEVLHYHNSMLIAMFVRKKMKRDISENIFKMHF